MTESDYTNWKDAALAEHLAEYREQCLRSAEQAMRWATNAVQQYRDSFNVTVT